MYKQIATLLFLSCLVLACSPPQDHSIELASEEQQEISQRANLINESLKRCSLFMHAWLDEADAKTGLIPRNLEEDRNIWNAKDAAADNYPFMVLTAALTDDSLFAGRMHKMLKTETNLTSRLGAMPDTYSFVEEGFTTTKPDTPSIVFGASEYVKDGLLPLTEWLGPSPWSDRMISILEDMWSQAHIAVPGGYITSNNVEVNGEMLQTLSRVYWMTGEEKFLDYAILLGDYYLLIDHHPTLDFESLRLRDHGCEIVSGLCELYAAVAFARPDKREEYRESLHAMLDDILSVGRNQDGLFFNIVNPQTGEVTNEGIADNFGYTLNGYYTVYLLDSIDRYRKAALDALSSLAAGYRSYDWENGSADGYADAIEGALNLYNRENLSSVANWMDSEIRVMWEMQQPSGIIEGWHGDGNFARTTIMYAFWKSQGTYLKPWKPDLYWGALMRGDTLLIQVRAETEWEGKIYFDVPRHAVNMHLPLDWPRINQFPEWFVVRSDTQYDITSSQGYHQLIGAESLAQGLQCSIASDEVLTIQVVKSP